MTHNVLFIRRGIPAVAWKSQEAWNQQMTPKLANEAFSAKSTQIIRLERHKEPCNTEKWTRKRGM